MPRPPRIEFEGALYHVMARGNGRKRIFLADDDHLRFLRQLRDNLQTHDVVLHAYVLMPNHYHLLLRTRRANLSRFMQRLNTSYALYFRFKHDAPGHVFQGRYGAKLVENDEYLVALARYIHLNPVKVAGKSKLAKAERASRLAGFPWSSYPGYVRKKDQQPWICYDLLEQFGNTPTAARRHYRAHVHACLMEDDRPLREALRASDHAIGSDSYVRQIEQSLQQRRSGRPSDRDLALPPKELDLETICRVVGNAFGLDPAELRRHGNRAGEPKALALELACRHSGLTQREIGWYFGNISSMAVCMSRRRFREGHEPQANQVALEKTLATLERAIAKMK